MIEVIAFDADDTLWENETLYHRAKGELADLLSPYQDPGWVNRKLDEIEVSNLQVYGYGIKSFTLSMIGTAAEAVDSKIEAPQSYRASPFAIVLGLRFDTGDQGRSVRTTKENRPLGY